MWRNIIKKFENASLILRDSDGATWNAAASNELAEAVTAGASPEEVSRLTKSFVEDCGTINLVIRRWYMTGHLPDNEFCRMFSLYMNYEYTEALRIVLSSFSSVSMNSTIHTNNEIDSAEIINMYTKFIPDFVLSALIERCIFTRNFSKSELLNTKRSIGDWFAHCAKMGWLSFNPYVYKSKDNIQLVLKYNRIIRFDGECWGIYTSGSRNSYWYKGACIGANVWKLDSPKFMNVLLWTALLNVGCRMTEFNKLLNDECDLVTSFVLDVSKFWSIKVEKRNFIDIFMECLTNVDSSREMDYRVPKDSNNEYARLSVTGAWTGVVEVPNGICPQTVMYDFKHLLINDKTYSKLKYEFSSKEVCDTLLCGVLALAGVMIDDKSVYAMSRESVLRTGHKNDLVDINTTDDIPHYVVS